MGERRQGGRRWRGQSNQPKAGMGRRRQGSYIHDGFPNPDKGVRRRERGLTLDVFKEMLADAKEWEPLHREEKINYSFGELKGAIERYCNAHISECDIRKANPKCRIYSRGECRGLGLKEGPREGAYNHDPLIRLEKLTARDPGILGFLREEGYLRKE